jgi:hypothetical protein
MTFRYRDQRGSLDASMKTVVELADKMALIKHLQDEYGFDRLRDADIEVTWYGYDSRIDWQTWLVSIDEHAVGFTDGPVA